MTRPVIYLACPFTDPDELVRSRRLLESIKFERALYDAGALVYNPLRYSSNAPYKPEYRYWIDHGLAIMKACDGVAVLKLDGWRSSEGVRGEIELAKMFEKPVFESDGGDAAYICESVWRRRVGPAS